MWKLYQIVLFFQWHFICVFFPVFLLLLLACRKFRERERDRERKKRRKIFETCFACFYFYWIFINFHIQFSSHGEDLCNALYVLMVSLLFGSLSVVLYFFSLGFFVFCCFYYFGVLQFLQISNVDIPRAKYYGHDLHLHTKWSRHYVFFIFLARFSLSLSFTCDLVNVY